MNFILNLLKGIALGAGCILPGISSGVLCVVFGIYDKLVNSILNIFKDFKKNFLFLLPIFIGVAIGIFLFGNILKYLFFNFENTIKIIFAGLILGCIPSILKNTNKNSKGFRLHYLIYTFLTFAISIFLIIAENKLAPLNTFNITFLFLFFAGFLMSIGIIFPGISSTVILMCLGVYSLYLQSISTINLQVLIPMGIGIICGSFVFLKIVNFIMENFYIQTMYSIIGFVIGSIIILLPSSFSLFNILLFVIGIIISILFEKLAT